MVMKVDCNLAIVAKLKAKFEGPKRCEITLKLTCLDLQVLYDVSHCYLQLFNLFGEVVNNWGLK